MKNKFVKCCFPLIFSQIFSKKSRHFEGFALKIGGNGEFK